MKKNIVMLLILMYGLIFTVGLMAQGSKMVIEGKVNDTAKTTATVTNIRQEIKIVERKIKKQSEIEKSRRVRLKRNINDYTKIDEVVFLDENGKVKKTLPGTFYNVKTLSERLITSSEDNKFIVIVDNKSKKNTREMLYRTGWAYDLKSNITIYNDNGEMLLKKDGLSCSNVLLSSDGQRFLCFEGNIDTGVDGTIITEIIDPCKMASISVYTIKGELIYKKTSGEIANICGFHSPNFSPSGNWIVVRTHDDKICVFGVDTKEEYVLKDMDITDNLSLHNYDAINDDGELEFSKLKRGKVIAKYTFKPQNKILFKLTEE